MEDEILNVGTCENGECQDCEIPAVAPVEETTEENKEVTE